MRAIYSFVIDGGAPFVTQTRILLATLTSTGVRPEEIVAHYTPRAWAESVAIARGFGVLTMPVEPFLDGRGCNKLNQLPSLLGLDADIYVLCDTDLAFVASISPLFDPDRARARRVGLANPPLHVLSRLLASRGLVATPRFVRTMFDGQPTWSVNCNGGLYLLPRWLLEGIASSWRDETEFCFSRGDILGQWRRNADQIGFAMAMLGAGLDVLELPLDANLPLLPADRLKGVDITRPTVLHHHMRVGATGLLMETGHPRVDEAVASINAVLKAGESASRFARGGAPG